MASFGLINSIDGVTHICEEEPITDIGISVAFAELGSCNFLTIVKCPLLFGKFGRFDINRFCFG